MKRAPRLRCASARSRPNGQGRGRGLPLGVRSRLVRRLRWHAAAAAAKRGEVSPICTGGRVSARARAFSIHKRTVPGFISSCGRRPDPARLGPAPLVAGKPQNSPEAEAEARTSVQQRRALRQLLWRQPRLLLLVPLLPLRRPAARCRPRPRPPPALVLQAGPQRPPPPPAPRLQRGHILAVLDYLCVTPTPQTKNLLHRFGMPRPTPTRRG
jgi:hypothetical protein